MLSNLRVMPSFTSIRALCQTGQLAKAWRAAPPVAGRLPVYSAPARHNLFGRLFTACSSASARRLRACGRLNTFMRDDAAEPALAAEAGQRLAVRDIAVKKFCRAAAGQAPKSQQDMVRKLSDAALTGLLASLRPAEPEGVVTPLERSVCVEIVYRAQQSPAAPSVTQCATAAAERLQAFAAHAMLLQNERSARAWERNAVTPPSVDGVSPVSNQAPVRPASPLQIVSWAWGWNNT